MVDGIKVFLKNLLLALMEDKFLELRVEYAVMAMVLFIQFC